jgi:hypothetical protein
MSPHEESAAEYRAFAVECLRLAQTAPDAADYALLVEMAVRWYTLAEAETVHEAERSRRRKTRLSQHKNRF